MCSAPRLIARLASAVLALVPVWLLVALAPGQQRAAPDRSALAPIDVDGDEVPELESVHAWAVAGEPAAKAGRIAVLVEQRLLEAREGLAAGRLEALRARLRRFAADLAGEGWRAEVLAVRCARGGAHRDGAMVLALRRVLQALRAEPAGLVGAVLVGHFPDALLVRTCNWRKRGKLTLRGKTPDKHVYRKPVRYLRRCPEIVSPRCDLVLADLDGGWEKLYVEAPTRLPVVRAVFPSGVPAGGGPADDLEVGAVRYTDFFHVDDGRVEVDAARREVRIDDATCDLECTAGDRRRPQPLAQPDIAISRLDSRGVAWSPRQRLGDLALLDQNGRPRAVELPEGVPAPDWAKDLWQPDPDLELRLLVEYFDRNHAYRTGHPGDAFRPASIACGLGSGMASLRRATSAWKKFSADGYDVRSGASLTDLVAWLQRPAVLRTLRAHSNPRVSVFRKVPAAALAAVTGAPWCWNVRGRELVPSLAPATRGGRADFFLFRTLWANHVLPDDPYLMIHTGCEAVAPPGATRLPYDDRRYGARPNAASLLFYTPCLALVGRAKVFYDEPRGFCEALAEGATFGAAWRCYFELESRAASRGKVGGDIGRKRSYFWSVLGDWTLRLRR